MSRLSLVAFRNLTVGLILLGCAGTARAAIIDLDFTVLNDGPLAERLTHLLDPELARAATESAEGDADSAEAVIPAMAADITRVMVTWERRKAPLIARYRGLDAAAVVERMRAAGGEAVPGPLGEATALLGDYQPLCIVALPDNDLLLTTRERYTDLETAPRWPRANPNLIIQGIADNDDVKLGAVKDRIHALYIEWNRHTDRIALTAHTPTHDDAREVRNYITRRRPWVHLASGVGFSSLDYPSRLLDDAEIDLHQRTRVLLTRHLDERLRTDTVQALADLVNRQIGKMIE